jgi:hypothetical protein
MLCDSYRGIALSGFKATPPSTIRLGGVVAFKGVLISDCECPNYGINLSFVD